MELLTRKHQESYENAKIWFICKKKKLKINIWKRENTIKLEIIVIIQGSKELLLIEYVIQNIVYLKNFL